MGNLNVFLLPFQIARECRPEPETDGVEEAAVDDVAIPQDEDLFPQETDSGNDGVQVLDNLEKAASLQGRRHVRRRQSNNCEALLEQMASNVQTGTNLLFQILHKTDEGPRSGFLSFLKENILALSDQEYEIVKRDLQGYFYARASSGKLLYT